MTERTIFELKETINKNRLQALILSDLIDDEEKKTLKRYSKNIGRDGKAKVSYSKKCNMGRRYAEGGLSLQMFSKKIRQSLVYDTHIDIDIVNCHLVILSQYCKKNNINCPLIDEYNSQRNIRLQELMTKCNISKKVAKEFILTIMYLGQSGDYCANHGFSDVPPSWCDKLANEFIQVSNLIVGQNQEILKTISASRKKDFTNKKASTVSFVLQIIEDEIIMTARTKLIELGFEVETLCFDGLMILMKDITRDHLNDLNAYCFEKTGYNIEFEIKPMTNVLNLQDEEDNDDDIVYDFLHTDYYNQEYCSTLILETPKQTYKLRKKYIELFLCKVITPDACFIFQNGKDKEPYIYSSMNMSVLLKPIQSGMITEMGNSISFWDAWSADPKQRIYRKYDFIPYNMVRPDTSIFNMFLGMNEDIYGKPSENPEKTLKPWFDIVRELCGGSDKDAEYLHKFFANIFQEPTKRPPVSIIIKGKQGTGKNIVLDAIGNMIDKEHYITTSKAEDLFGDHAEGFYRKLLVNLNEAEGKDTFNFEGKIKSFITEDTITVNPKFVRPSKVSNQARLVITTNKETPIPIDVKSKDRRYVVYKTTEEYLKYSQAFWGKLYNHLRKPEFMATLHQYYMKMDLKNFDWIKERPITKAYRDMCSLYSPTEALFMCDYIENTRWIIADEDVSPEVDKNLSIDVKCQDLFDEYLSYCKTNRFNGDNCPNSRAFGGRLVGLCLPMDKIKNVTNYWRFIPNDVYKFMEKQRWINDFGDDTDFNDEGIDADDDYF